MSTSLPKTIRKRPAIDADETFVSNLIHLTMQSFVFEEWPDDSVACEDYWLAKHFDRDKTQIVELEGRPVGAITTTVKATSIYIDQVHLLPLAQGKGIGKWLITDVITLAKEMKLSVSLTVLNSNIPAQELYKRLGFIEVHSNDSHRKHMEFHHQADSM